MAAPQKHPWEIRVFHAGVDRDTEPEFITKEQGSAIDSCNTRGNSGDGDSGARDKILGEVVLYANVNNNCWDGDDQPFSDSYNCIGSARINNHHVECWADADEIGDPYIRIDGKVVAKSPDITFLAQFPLQVGINESCTGGEIYLTDYNKPPLLFNIEDLMRNGGMIDGFDCTDKYFDSFNITEHLLILQLSQEHPMFMQLTTDNSVAEHIFIPEEPVGMPIGLHSYSVRYSTESGDKTEWSMPTPQIPVVRQFSSRCTDGFPYAATYAGASNLESPTSFGVHLRVRINNRENYDFMEIRRDSWKSSDPLGTLPVSEIVGLIELVPGELRVANILDYNGSEEVLSTIEATTVMSAISRAKAIRYFNRRLYLANVEYTSRVLDEAEYELIESQFTGNAMDPVMRKMGQAGHQDPWHAAYHKSYMALEKFGYALVFWDGQGGSTFADPITGYDNYQMPSRRKAMTQESLEMSYYGKVKTATEQGLVNDVYEVFDLENAKQKPDSCEVFNILSSGSKGQGQMNDVPGCDDVNDDWVNGLGQVKAEDVGFRPFRPVGHSDDSCTGSKYRPNIGILNDGDISNPFIDYNPKGFNPDYYARGISLKGLSSWPSWAKAFSVVRTRPAKKVVAQGIGHYALNSAGGGFGANTTKETDKLWCYFPDLDSQLGIDPDIIQNIQDAPGDYSIRLVAPLGFFSEIYSFKNSTLGSDRQIDMITYARILKEVFVGGTAQINPEAPSGMGLAGDPNERHVGYGHWHRTTPQPNGVFANAQNGDTEFNISSFVEQGLLAGRGEYFVVGSDTDFYWHSGVGGNFVSANDGPVQEWHEPLYIVQIIKNTADVSTQNVQQYEHTGQYQKIESVIGISDGGLDQGYQLVDERWEDCIPTISAVPAAEQTGSIYQLQHDRFLYVRDDQGNVTRWVNVTYKAQSVINDILTDITNNGSATISDYTGNHVVHGVYTHSEQYIGDAPVLTINFGVLESDLSLDAQRPQNGFEILVRYDNRIPVQIFGGDSWINEVMWAPLDLRYASNSLPQTDIDSFTLNLPFPNRAYRLNPRIMQANKTTGINKIQDAEKVKFDNILGSSPAEVRQLVNMFCCESRIHMGFSYGSSSLSGERHTYPKKQYVMRPHEWNPDPSDEDFVDENNLHSGYQDEYGNEWVNWNYGGFRFRPITNIDFSKDNRRLAVVSSAPAIGFKEQNLFCTRAIWSAERAVNVQNAPGVRTFPDINFYDIPDDNGEIKKLWSALTERGQNLYAFTATGVAILLTDKRLLNEADGQILGEIGADTAGVIKHIWISETIGIADEFWRGFAEWNNKCWWPTRLGVFSMSQNQIKDISRNKYLTGLKPVLDGIAAGYRDNMAGGFDAWHREYILVVKRRGDQYNQQPEKIFAEQDIFIVDAPPFPEEIPTQYYIGLQAYQMEENEVITFANYTPFDQQSGIWIGGIPGAVLTHPIYICIHPNSTHNVKIKVRNDWGANDWNFTLIAVPGQCYKFTPYTLYDLFSDEIAATLEYNWPFGPAIYHNIELVDLDANAEQWYPNKCQAFRFSEERQQWQGRSAHEYDELLEDENRIFGMREGTTYELNQGFVLNGETITADFIGTCIGEQPWDKEFVRMRINSNVKPTSVKFYLSRADALADNELCEVTGGQLKSRYGYEFNIPRKLVERHRLQGRILFYRIIHNLAEEFKVIDVQTQYKRLK